MNHKKKPTPLLSENEPADWFFAFKFNSQTMPGCTDDGKAPAIGSKGLFGGKVKNYVEKRKPGKNKGKSEPPKPPVIRYGLHYIVASDKNPHFVKGNECLGTTLKDPLGATFAQVYNSNDYYYFIWNDQLYGHPRDNAGYIKDGKWVNSGIPWGHSKGMLAWNKDGEGFVLQVSTPSWPASASHLHPRRGDGNTLGCINDDDVEVSQHFFCLGINKEDLVNILKALANSSVVTVQGNPGIVRNGGPADVQDLVNKIGKLNSSKEITIAELSSGVKLISKPSLLQCPPWQLVSAKLNGLPLRVASWWDTPAIYSTNSKTKITCWPAGLRKPGPIEIALSGEWNGLTFGFKGVGQPYGNHAKIAISTDQSKPYCLFGDMNQMGTLEPMQDDKDKNNKVLTCNIHQNGRGGLFYVMENRELFTDLTKLLHGDTASLQK